MPTTKTQKIRIYETYMVLDTAVTKEQQDALVAKVKRAVEDCGGKLVLELSRGKRKLSYVLKKRTEALHHVTYSEGPGGIPAEITQVLRFDPSVLRAQTFVVDKVPDPQAEAAEAAMTSTSPEPSDPAYQDTRDGEL